jgi:hypothetical protein
MIKGCEAGKQPTYGRAPGNIVVRKVQNIPCGMERSTRPNVLSLRATLSLLPDTILRNDLCDLVMSYDLNPLGTITDDGTHKYI